MKILVLSDAHGDRLALKRAVTLQNDADALIFLGDGGSAQELLPEIFPRPIYAVSGNCDFNTFGAPDKICKEFAGKRIFACHGHKFSVKSTLCVLEDEARQRRADVVLFGHTHIPFEEYRDGIYFLNPGSIAGSRSGAAVQRGTFGVLEITDKGVVTGIGRI